MTPPGADHQQTGAKAGVAAAIACPVIWGITPVYFHYLAKLGVAEALAQRALWAAILLFLCVLPFGYAAPIARIFKNRRMVIKLLMASSLVALNWGTFLVAVAQENLVASSFGYFIYPLMAICIGVFWLNEKLTPQSWCAVALAGIGVLYKAFILGGVPWIALILGASFALYALLRKQMEADPVAAMVAELLLLAPVALIALLFISYAGAQPTCSFFFDGSAYGVIMAISSGIVTAIPLVLFHIGNRALPLSMTGFLFYINPTLQLMVGLFIFAEPFSYHELGAFCLIWLGLILYLSQPKSAKKMA